MVAARDQPVDGAGEDQDVADARQAVEMALADHAADDPLADPQDAGHLGRREHGRLAHPARRRASTAAW